MNSPIPNPRMKATALFNKLNGEFVTVVSLTLADSQHNEDYYIAREVDYLFGPEGDKIVGNLVINPTTGTVTDNFKVVPYAEQTTVITEAQMNAMAAEKITGKYPITSQINLIAKAVMRLGNEAGLMKTDEFDALNEMLEYIEYCLQVNQTKKEHYRNDPDVVYESNAETAARLSRRMEGGVHEELGPRSITGGSVFS